MIEEIPKETKMEEPNVITQKPMEEETVKEETITEEKIEEPTMEEKPKPEEPNANNPKGGITEMELSIDISNISLITSDGQPTRVGFKIEKDKKVRYSKKSDEVL